MIKPNSLQENETRVLNITSNFERRMLCCVRWALFCSPKARCENGNAGRLWVFVEQWWIQTHRYSDPKTQWMTRENTWIQRFKRKQSCDVWSNQYKTEDGRRKTELDSEWDWRNKAWICWTKTGWILLKRRNIWPVVSCEFVHRLGTTLRNLKRRFRAGPLWMLEEWRIWRRINGKQYSKGNTEIRETFWVLEQVRDEDVSIKKEKKRANVATIRKTKPIVASVLQHRSNSKIGIPQAMVAHSISRWWWRANDGSGAKSAGSGRARIGRYADVVRTYTEMVWTRSGFDLCRWRGIDGCTEAPIQKREQTDGKRRIGAELLEPNEARGWERADTSHCGRFDTLEWSRCNWPVLET